MIQTCSAPQNDRQNFSFVKNTYVDVEKLARNGRKTATYYAAFFLPHYRRVLFLHLLVFNLCERLPSQTLVGDPGSGQTPAGRTLMGRTLMGRTLMGRTPTGRTLAGRTLEAGHRRVGPRPAGPLTGKFRWFFLGGYIL